ncbi:MAG: DUF6531 domain-containing protein [Acidimicrobiales bacterium]
MNTASGDFYTNSTDLSIPGAGVPLDFVRTYSSVVAQSETQAGKPSPLGYGWSSNLTMSVSLNSSNDAVVTNANGSESSFIPTATAPSADSWCSGVSTNYCPLAPRTLGSLNHNADGSWTLISEVAGQATYTFNSSGSLTEITDEQGDTLSSATGTPGSSGCLTTATTCTIWTSSASGRTLAVSYDSATPAQIVAVVGSGGLSVSFSYYSGAASDSLYSATTQSGTTKYSYDTTQASPYQHDLLVVTNPNGTQTQNTYNSAGQISGQTEPTGEVLSFTYSGSNLTSAGGSTTVTTTNGKISSSDIYDYVSGVLLWEEMGNPAPSSSAMYIYSRDPTSLEATSVTNPTGDTTSYALGSDSLSGFNASCSTSAANCGALVTSSTDPMGNKALYTYTNGISGVPNGLRYCTVSPVEALKGVTCPKYGLTLAGASTKTFNSTGEVLSTTNSNGATTTNCYYNETSTCASSANQANDGGNSTLLYTATGPNGDVTSYTYNQAGQVTESTVTFNGYSATTINAYDSSGRLYCTESPYDVSLDIFFSSGAASYPYNCPTPPPTSPPTPGTSPWNGARVTIYNSSGKVADTVSPIGGVTQYAYDGLGNQYCTVGPLAYAQGKTCPSSPPTSPPTQGNDPYLGATINTYNALGQVVQTTDPIGGITLNTYDQAGNLTETQVEPVTANSNASTVTTTYTYDADNQQTSSTVDPGSSLAETTKQFYNPNGQVYCSVSANAYSKGQYSSTNTSGYQCPTWQGSWGTSPPSPSTLYSTSPSSSQANNVTTSFYNADGNLVQTTNPNVDTTATAYDPNGRPYCQIDPVNFAKGTTCPTSPPTSAPTGTVTGYTTTIYDAAGNTLSTTDPVGNTTAYTYSPTGLKLTATTGAGSSAAQTTTYCYYQPTSCPKSGAPPNGGGAASMLYSIQVPSGEITTSTYFPGGSLETKTNPAGTANYVYWTNGQLLRFTDSNPSGYAPTLPITKTYYQDGQLCWSARIAVTTVPSCANPPSTGVTTYTYDLAGDMLSQSYVPPSTLPAGFTLNPQTISYTYYRPGNIAQVVYPTYGSVTKPTATYTYDATGQMTSVTDWSGNKTTFSHDLNGNLASQVAPGGVSTKFSYDSSNLMTQAVTDLGFFTSGISPQVTTSGSTKKTGSSTSTTPLTTKTMEGYFGTAKKPATISASTATSTCTNSSATLTQNFAPGLSPTPGSYNQDGQVTQYYQEYLTNCGNSAALQRNYSYDQAGHLTYQGSAPQGSAANNFSYDPSNNPTLVSSHDAAGNFDTYSQSFNSGGQVTSETPITGSKGGSYAYSYNSIGALSNSVSGGYNLSYGYNTIGQMTSYSFISATNYLYNAAGLESALSTGGATTQFTWGNLGGMPQLLSDSKDYFIYGPGSTPVEQYNITTSPPSSNPTFLTYFKPSDSWLVTNLTGQVTNVAGYDAGGNLSNGSPGTIFGYQGQYQDTSTNTTGFTNMRARWYDTQSGVFTSVDPAISSTNQPYQFANGDPVNNSDPSGLATVGICVGVNTMLGGVFNLTAGDCLARTRDSSGEDDIGLVRTFGGGVGIGEGVGASLYYQVSNATNLQELAGPFLYFSVSGEDEVGGTATVFYNDNSGHGGLIYGIDVGLSVGEGASVAYGVSYTLVTQFNGTTSANIARGVWDAFNPGLDIGFSLFQARQGVKQAKASFTKKC